ncbi:MAG: addiction module toxin, HicA family [Candidatus Tagabacteria bacterium CG09_land_8_20_14_0_10_41_14]|uniref:Addiction module toxin, HicA family n=2 Tax=Candidatus Tagaibacteriota TaxID=1817918 RepID=A0A2H0WMV2_9BACT|nr:MAG: addiction module toxin, HicA family [Candidatus Tagabacteria bacterium CG09_land_8_20_14_0_10_41_14]PJE73253.1 MAG: addiction module toxin, HicA family [Candidatus Tagabacteria bacterium CG10_big_fil_rev_8_21_14_0_10_40_13]
MSRRFPVLRYRDVVKVAKKLGFYFCRQAKGSHEIWRRDEDGRQTTIPKSRKIIKRRTVKAILEDFQITIDKVRKLLKK